MRVRQAAAIAGVSAYTIRRWYRKGAIRKWTDGGGRTVYVDILECVSREVYDAHAVTAGGDAPRGTRDAWTGRTER